MNLTLTNTLGSRKAPFEPLREGAATVYTCGPTVKEPINIDKFRSYLLSDLLRRYLEFSGLRVKQVMNITDVGHLNEFEEDVVEVAAGRSGKQPWELVEEEEEEFHQHRRQLRILDAHHYPRARDNIPEMIALVERLLKAGFAYRAGDNVYFDVSKFADFGKLTGKSLASLEELHGDLRVPPHPEKHHPLDIDLWRTDILHRMHWSSPWGRGYPGWHLECVVMSRKYLGDTFDIHIGSQEIVYPHHECEIAQAEAATGTPLARYWLHSAHVLVDGKPTLRTNQNLITVKGLLEMDISGVEIRAALLSEHYRKPLEFTPDRIEVARDTLARLREAGRKLRRPVAAGKKSPETAEGVKEAERAFRDALDDDLDFPRALEAALDLAAQVTDGTIPPSPTVAQAFDRMDTVLGFLEGDD